MGLAETIRILSSHYHLVITNVPYLARGKQNERLRKFAETRYPNAKNDLANVFLERCLEFSPPEGGCVVQIVMPQNWLFLTSYKGQREHLLKELRWNLLARLGSGAFETISGEVVNVILLTLTCARPHAESRLHGIDASASPTTAVKAVMLRQGEVVVVSQEGQLGNPDARITLEERSTLALLAEFANSYQGITTGDNPRFICFFWELSEWGSIWKTFQSTGDRTEHFSGREQVFLWENGKGVLASSDAARIQGRIAWEERGISVRQMQQLPATINSGSPWDMNCATIVPKAVALLPAIWCFCASPEYNEAVRRLDQKMNVTNATLVKVPFDVDRWTKVAADSYPKGLPKPHSDAPTQWMFHGHPCGSVVWNADIRWTTRGPLRTDASVLQIAIARLLGYHWPAERDRGMELSDEQREWVDRTKDFYALKDKDGIVCIPSVRGESPAQERLLQLLRAAYRDEWHDSIPGKLLNESGKDSLDDWLRNQFFEDHCKLFQHRPFIWHIWDGRKHDGFHALVNYHKLSEGDGKGRRLLESLTYSYLGDWIGRQQDGVKRGEGGAEDRLSAALELQKHLVAILEGESPFDVFVRWKPIEYQAIGWEPDINDGVRLNIRPFMVQDLPGGKKGAGILRAKPNIHWKKDRGKEPVREQAQYPWFWENGKFTGERVNDVHLTNAEKRSARERARERI